MVQRGLIEEDGYTVVEILVALTIVSIILGIVGTVFIFVSVQIHKWDKSVEFYNEFHVIQQQLTHDFIKAEEVIVTDSLLIITHESDKIVTYTLNDAKLKRKGKFISNSDTLLLLMNTNVDREHVWTWRLLQASDRKREVSDFILSSRKPVMWKPLKDNDSE